MSRGKDLIVFAHSLHTSSASSLKSISTRTLMGVLYMAPDPFVFFHLKKRILLFSSKQT